VITGILGVITKAGVCLKFRKKPASERDKQPQNDGSVRDSPKKNAIKRPSKLKGAHHG